MSASTNANPVAGTNASSAADGPGASRAAPGRAILSIRWIVTGAAIALTAAAVLTVSAVSEHNARRALTQELESRLVLNARNLALTSAPALLGDFPELTLHPLVKELKAKQPELSLVVVVDARGLIQGHADAHQLGAPYVAPSEVRALTPGIPLAAGEAIRGEGELMVALSPVKHPDGREMGSAMVGMPRAYLDGLILAARRQQTMLLIGFLIAGIVISFVLVSQLLKPIGALRSGIERIARGDLDTAVEVQDRTELGLLASAMNQMASDLKRAQQEMLERERLSHELALAQDIQRSLLPKERLLAGDYAIEGTQRAAAEVGGDYFDYFPLPDGRVGLAVADVAGKGLAGCLVMSMLSALLRAYRVSIVSPTEMLVALDQRLCETLKPGSFVTMFYAVLDPASGEMTWASAGHNPMLVYRSGIRAVEAIAGRGIPLGAVRGAIRSTLRDAVVTLEPGDVFVQYTDGINEAFDPAGREQFGVSRMEAAIAASASEGGSAVIASLHRSLRDWTGDGPQDDDETVLVVGRATAAPREVAITAGPAAAASCDSLRLLGEARARGHRLPLTADLDSLLAIGPWLRSEGLVDGLPESEIEPMELALYEACANVAEHGYKGEVSRQFELWWIPPAADPPAGGVASSDVERAVARLASGHFVIRDEGIAFRPDRWRETDFTDPRARRRGRGYGLDIIHRVVRQLAYHPGTPDGNLTVLTFGASPEAQGSKEVRHV